MLEGGGSDGEDEVAGFDGDDMVSVSNCVDSRGVVDVYH